MAATPQLAPTPQETQRNPFGWRAFFVGSLGALAVGAGCPYGSLVLKGSYMDLDFSTPGAIFLLFVLTALINPALARLRPRWALTPAECIIVYIMMICASAIPIMGLTGQLLPIPSAAKYYASPENKWDELILPHVNPLLIPDSDRAITDFFEGLTRQAHVPWDAWWRTLAVWVPFLLCLHFVMICLMVISRKQWVASERLVYPLTQLPLAAVQASPQGRLAPLYRNPVLWAGFAVPLLITSMIGLHNHFAGVPLPKLVFGYPMFRHTMTLSLRCSFPMIGFFYLVEQQTTFSLWLFNLVFFVIQGTLNVFQIGLHEAVGPFGARATEFKYVGMGAFIALVVGGLRVSRAHLADIVRKAFRGDRDVDDSDEMLSYRTAVWGSIIGLGLLGAWLNWSGLPLLIVPVFLGFAMILFIGLTRVVCESGMAEAVAPTIAPGMTLGLLGTSALGPKGLVGLAMSYVWCSDIRTFVMASAANGLKLAEVLPRRKRALFPAMMLAVILALGASGYLIMTWAYGVGGSTLNNWFFISGPSAPYKWIASLLQHPQPPSLWGAILIAAGAGLMLLLTYLRQRFVWWPLHPLGFAIAPVWIMDQLWLTIFISWALKTIILRYGGPRLFERARPFFLGLILGQFFTNGVWLFIDHFTGMRGNQIFWI